MSSTTEGGVDAASRGVSEEFPVSEIIAGDHGAAAAGTLPERPRWRLPRVAGDSLSADFARFWAGQTISQVGTQFTAVALPLLAALSLGASPIGVGVLAAAAGLPHLLFGLLAGAWIDRLRRRPVMIAADLGRAALLLTVPLAAWRGVLSLELLIAVAFFMETLTVFFDIAYLSYVPVLVSRSGLIAANSRLEATASGARVVGPALAGALVRWLGAPLATLVDAVSYLGSALFLWKIRTPEPAPRGDHPSDSMLAEIREGLRAVWRSPTLRALALSSGMVNLAGFLFLSIYVLYMTRDLGLGADAVGLVFAAGGAGALLGSLTAGPARGRWGVGPVLVGSQVLFGLTGMLVPLAVLFPVHAPPLVVGAEFLQWVMVLVYDVNAVSLRQAVTPDRLLGRVNGTMRFLIWGTRPIGSLAGGYLGSRIGLPLTLVVGAFGMLLAFAPLLASPIPRLRAIESAKPDAAKPNRGEMGLAPSVNSRYRALTRLGHRALSKKGICQHGCAAIRRGSSFIGNEADPPWHVAAPCRLRWGADCGRSSGAGQGWIQLRLHRLRLRVRDAASLQFPARLLPIVARHAGRRRGLLQRERLQCPLRGLRRLLLGLLQLGRHLPRVLLGLLREHGALRLT